jgi:hypothetical protein
MKVAVCLSGQPRAALDCFPFIYHNLILPNQADVFFHTYFDPDNLTMEKTHIGRGDCSVSPTLIEDLLQRYRPVKYLVEKPKSFFKPNMIVPSSRIKMSQEINKPQGWEVDQHKRHVLKGMMSMFYSIFKANELKENFANEQGFTYDYVIRVRFDCMPLQPIFCVNLQPNVLYYNDLGQPDKMPADWLNIGSNSIMNIYSSIYLNLEYFNSFEFFPLEERLPITVDTHECGGFNEYFVRDIMKLYRIPIQGLSIQCPLHRKS